MRDCGMIERREQLRFALEPRKPLAIPGEVLGQDFDRYLTPELRVTRSIDLPLYACESLKGD